MRKEFECKIRKFVSEKADSSHLMSDDRYSEIVQNTKEARERKRNGLSLSAKDYRRLKRFDVISVGDNDKLIHATDESHLEIKYYCRIGEMFDIIESVHHKLGHKKEKAMEVELRRKYCNITREVINAYLNLCQSCALKKEAKGKGVVKPKVVFELNSRCQLEEDMDNYREFKMMGVKKRMKKGIVPHIFSGQNDKICTSKAKRSKLNTISEMMLQPSTSQLAQEQELRIITATEKIPEQEVQLDVKTKLCTLLPSSAVTNAKNIRDNRINVNLPASFRSKAVMCKKVPTTVDAATSIKYPNLISKWNTSSEEESMKNNNVSSETDSEEDEVVNSLNFKFTTVCIGIKPKLYLGVSKLWYESGFIDILSKETKLSVRYINLTLIKIKLNDSFERLGDMFGVSENTAYRIFNKSVTCLSKFLRQLIYWPDHNTKLLPISFRLKYHDVKSIIDCLEIEISKPSHPVKHSVTWCEYRRCNVLKYLISFTSDGFINFVSEGYGGRITDVQLVEESSSYLNALPEGSGVLVHRGFNGILPLIKNKNCRLIRLPSISTREDALLSNLRIHMETVVRQLREFEMLKPHSVLHSSLISIIDNIVIIAAALINLQ